MSTVTMFPTAALIAIGVWLILALFALLLLFSGLKGLLQRRLAAGTTKLCFSLVLSAVLTAVAGLGMVLQTYDRLTHEQAAVELQFEGLNAQHYRVTLTFPDGETLELELTGDEWQIDARVLRWKGPAVVAGMDTLFRVDRISGRFRELDRERDGPRSVHALHPSNQTLDPWTLARRYPDRTPWVDALYGSATYLPMADKARFEVVVTQTGLAARPSNDAARRAVRSWD